MNHSWKIHLSVQYSTLYTFLLITVRLKTLCSCLFYASWMVIYRACLFFCYFNNWTKIRSNVTEDFLSHVTYDVMRMTLTGHPSIWMQNEKHKWGLDWCDGITFVGCTSSRWTEEYKRSNHGLRWPEISEWHWVKTSKERIWNEFWLVLVILLYALNSFLNWNKHFKNWYTGLMVIQGGMY